MRTFVLLGVILVFSVMLAIGPTVALAQDSGTDLPRPSDGYGNGGGVRARATDRPVPSAELVDYLLSELVAARSKLAAPSRPDEEESAIPPESIAGAYRLKGDIRPDGQEVDDPQQVAGAFRLKGDIRPDDQEVDDPQQVAGAFRLHGGVIRGEDLTSALYELMLDPALRARLASVPLGQGIVPADLQDKAFEKYVDLRLLGDAWARLDAARLVDVAMQLAEGERILLRAHRAISATDALKLAAKTAIDLGDTVTLERLQRIAQAHNDQGLAALLASGAKLASAARDADEKDEVIIHAENTGPAQYALLHACCRDLKRAQLAGDAKTMQVLEQVIPQLPLITKEQKEQLLKTAKQPTSAADAKTAQLQKTLHLLAGISRSCDINDKNCFPNQSGSGFSRLQGESRCQFGDCGETGGIGGGFNKLQGESRGDAGLGGRYLSTAEALEDLENAHRVSPEERAAASSVLEKLRSASRGCDLATGSECGGL